MYATERHVTEFIENSFMIIKIQWWTEPDRTYRIYRTGSVSGSVRSGSVFSSNTEPDFSNESVPLNEI